jgi:hypothetical protein
MNEVTYFPNLNFHGQQCKLLLGLEKETGKCTMLDPLNNLELVNETGYRDPWTDSGIHRPTVNGGQ